MEGFLYQIVSQGLVHGVQVAVAAGPDESHGVVKRGTGQGRGDDAGGQAFAEAHHFVGGLPGQDLQQGNAFADAVQLVDQRVQLAQECVLRGNIRDHGPAHVVMAFAQGSQFRPESVFARLRHLGGADQLVRDAAQRGHHDDRGFATGTYDIFHFEDALRCSDRRTAELEDFHKLTNSFSTQSKAFLSFFQNKNQYSLLFPQKMARFVTVKRARSPQVSYGLS